MQRRLAVLGVLIGAGAVAVAAVALASSSTTSASAATTCTIYWTGKSSTAYATNGNWSLSDGGSAASRTPSSTDFACSSTTPVRTTIVASSANRTVGGFQLTNTSLELQGGVLTIGTYASTINALQIDAGGVAGAAPLTITGSSSAPSAAVTFTGATKTVAAGATFTATAPVTVGTAGGASAATSLVNQGTLNLIENSLSLASTGGSYTPASLVNTGTLSLTNAAINVSGTSSKLPTFTNSGTLRSTDDNGNNYASTVNAPFTNTGTVQIAGGSLNLAGPNASGTTDTGTWNTGSTAGASVVVTGSTRTFTAGAFTGSGGLQTNAGTTTFSSGVTVSNLIMNGGTVTGTVEVATGAFNGGTLTGNGTLTVSGSGTALGNVTISNGYTVTVSGSATINLNGNYGPYLVGGGHLTNSGSVSLVGSNNYYAVYDDGTATNSFVNGSTGTITVAVDPAVTAYLATPFTNRGSLFVNSGNLQLASGNVTGTTDTGTAAIPNGASLTFAAGTRSVDTGTVSGAGTLYVAGGTTAFQHSPSISNLVLDGGTVTGSVTVGTLNTTTYSGGMSGAGTMTVTGNAGVCGLSISGGYRLLNQGATTINTDCYYIQLNGGSTLENAGMLNVVNSNGYDLYTDGNSANAVVNDSGATMTVNLASNSTNFEIGPAFTNHGTVTLATGGLTLDAGTVFGTVDDGAYSVAAGNALSFAGGTRTVDTGTVSGAGTLYVAGGTTAFQHSPSISNLVLDGGTVTGSVTVGTLNTTTYSGGMSGAGTMTVTGSSGVCGVTVDGGYRLLNQGAMTVNTDCYYPRVFGGSTWENAGSMNFINSGNYGISTDGNANNAMINDAGATITTNLASAGATAEIDPAFTNHGTVALTTGGLYLYSGTASGTVDDGTYSTSAGSNLMFAGGTRTVDTGTVSGAGTLYVAGGTTAFQHSPSISNLVLDGGTVTGSVTVGTLNTTTYSGGMSGAGTMTVTGSSGVCGVTVDGGYRLLNQGAMTVNTDCYYPRVFGGSTWENAGSMNFINSGNYGISTDGNANNAMINDAGATITTNLASAGATAEIDPAFTNSGTVVVKKGQFTPTTVTNLTSSGVLTGGTWNATGGSLVLPVAVTTNAATVVIGTGGAVTASGGGAAFATLASNAGSFTTTPSLTTSTALLNTGTITVAGGTLRANTYAQSAGTTSIASGAALRANSAASGTIAVSGGLVTGVGSLQGKVTVSGTGTVAPGVGGAGTLSVSGSTYSSDANGKLAVTVGATNTGLTASTAVALNGTLAITTALPAPAIGMTVTVVTGSARTGTFSTVTGQDVPSAGGFWSVGYTSTTATLTLTAYPTVSVTGTTVAEGNSGVANAQFTVTLSAASGSPVTVNYATADGTATAGSDYTATSGALTFAPGTTSQTVAVPVIGDTLFENDESFVLTLSAASGATIGTGTATGTITNDDAAPTVSTADAGGATSASGGGTVTFPVTLSAPSGLPVTVQYATADGTAVAGTDYTSTSGTLTVPSGQTTASVVVPLTRVTTYAPNKTFTLTLSSPAGATVAGGTATGTIVNGNQSGPTATSVTPNQGPQGTATSVTIGGTNFSSGATVTVSGSGVVASGVTAVSATSLTATFTVDSAAATGSRDVTVTTGSGSSTCTGCFTVTPKSSVTGTSQSAFAQGNVDAVFSVSGSNFGPGSLVSLVKGSTTIDATSTSVASASSLTAVISISTTATLGTWNLVVENQDGGIGTCTNCVTIYAAPKLTSVSPSTVARGTSTVVTFTGTGFVPGAIVSVPQCTLTNVTVVSSTKITATVTPTRKATTGAKTVKVINPASAGNGTGTKSSGITIS